MMNLLNPDLSPEKNARLLYWRGFTCAEIARLMGIPDTTVRSWKTREGWDRATTARRIGEQIDVRLAVLVAKDEKSEKDYNEMDKLAKILERTARIERYEDGGNEADLNPKVRNRNEAKRRKAKERGDSGKIDDEMLTELKREFHKRIYPHQKAWYEHSKKYEMRQYVKSRQIGATFYFALEALLTALDTGKNQIFLSASKSQAHIFRSNIVAFVDEVLGIQLKGEHIKLAPRTTLYFLGTNSNTAQSYSGDLYIDEYFWIPQF